MKRINVKKVDGVPGAVELVNLPGEKNPFNVVLDCLFGVCSKKDYEKFKKKNPDFPYDEFEIDAKRAIELGLTLEISTEHPNFAMAIWDLVAYEKENK